MCSVCEYSAADTSSALIHLCFLFCTINNSLPAVMCKGWHFTHSQPSPYSFKCTWMVLKFPLTLNISLLLAQKLEGQVNKTTASKYEENDPNWKLLQMQLEARGRFNDIHMHISSNLKPKETSLTQSATPDPTTRLIQHGSSCCWESQTKPVELHNEQQNKCKLEKCRYGQKQYFHLCFLLLRHTHFCKTVCYITHNWQHVHLH